MGKRVLGREEGRSEPIARAVRWVGRAGAGSASRPITARAGSGKAGCRAPWGCRADSPPSTAGGLPSAGEWRLWPPVPLAEPHPSSTCRLLDAELVLPSLIMGSASQPEVLDPVRAA